VHSPRTRPHDRNRRPGTDRCASAPLSRSISTSKAHGPRNNGSAMRGRPSTRVAERLLTGPRHGVAAVRHAAALTGASSLVGGRSRLHNLREGAVLGRSVGGGEATEAAATTERPCSRGRSTGGVVRPEDLYQGCAVVDTARQPSEVALVADCQRKSRLAGPGIGTSLSHWRDPPAHNVRQLSWAEGGRDDVLVSLRIDDATA